MELPDKDSRLIEQQKQEENQPMLFPSSEIATQEMEKQGVFTGERLFQQRPEVYKAIVIGLGQGLGIRAMARAYQVHPSTIAAIREREKIPIDTIKGTIVKNLAEFVELGTERMIDEVNKMDRDKLPLGVSIAAEKMLLLQGQATSRVEHVKRPGIEEFNRVIDLLPEDAAEMDSGSGEEKQVSAGSGAPGGDRGVSVSPDGESNDVQSVVNDHSQRKTEQLDTVLDTGIPTSQHPAPHDSAENRRVGGEGGRHILPGEESGSH